MEELKYIIEDSTLAELLGNQNFTNQESAILELVKNAYDAKANQIDLIFNKDELIIKDDGIGMNSSDIKQHWMHIGKSDKAYETKDKNNIKRVLAGSKGIGRFALSRLGSDVTLYSRKNESENKSVLWSTNWNKNILQEIDTLDDIGTTIVIRGLRDKWNKSYIENLKKFLSRSYNDTAMKINITEENKPYTVHKYFVEPKLGYNCTSKIYLQYQSDKSLLVCKVESDEFRSEAQQYCTDIDINYYENTLNCLSELESNKELALSKEELKLALKELGDFSAEFYFSLKEPVSKDVEKFFYKYKILPERYESGITLYRNSFSISSYEGYKDWIGLGKRSRLSPAAATHLTGSWRVRENQIAGKIEIDKKENYMLRDLANRQGLDENIYFQIFGKILDKGIAEFERYRQSIIRKIDKKNKVVKADKKVVEKVIKNPVLVKKLSNDDLNKFITEIKEYKKENTDFKKEIHNTEERYKYDIRILNVLATSGLKAAAIAHEMHNDRNSIAQNYENIIQAFKGFGIWDFINDSERTKYAFSNIPELLDKNKRVNSKIVSFMDTMLSEVEKKNFFADDHNILELLEDIKAVWERDYAWIKIELDISSTIQYVLPEDVLKVIFDNLILNSIQNNDDRNHLSIYINITPIPGGLEFIFKDDGKGLNEKYINNPMKILEVHETSRKEGHGLGMWIINNTVVMSGGEITKIVGTDGFTFQFMLGGKYSG